jgi:glycosyltransferase involved in cell wall biosynthesis
MKIAIFFTYDYSTKTLDGAGVLERELKIYQKLNEVYGIEFIFFTYEEDPVSAVNYYSQFTFIPIYRYMKKSKYKTIRFFKSFLIPFKFKKDLIDIDILYQHQLLGVWIPLILKILLRKPLQVRTGYDAYLFSLENNDRFLKSFFYKYLTKLTLKFSDLYTVTSKCDKDFLTYKFKTKFIKVVPNWVDLNQNLPRNLKMDKILMVGRLEIQKNYTLAFDFIKLVNEDIELDIYGSGTEYPILHTLSNENALKVNFLGNTDHKNLLEEFSKYNYFLTTSSYEGNPKTVLEALSRQCIVFASNIPNHQELIKDGVNGFLFSNINELIEKFELIKDDIPRQNIIRKNSVNSLSNNKILNVSKLMYEDYVSLVSFK